MRKIKFRAFDIENNIMIKDNIVIDAYGDIYPYNILNNNVVFSSETHNIMQYTGVTDDNGIDIYEGDIVRLELEIPDGYDEYKRISIESEIKYVRCSFCYKHGRNWVELDYDKSDGESCVIIGNIYEK